MNVDLLPYRPSWLEPRTSLPFVEGGSTAPLRVQGPPARCHALYGQRDPHLKSDRHSRRKPGLQREMGDPTFNKWATLNRSEFLCPSEAPHLHNRNSSPFSCPRIAPAPPRLSVLQPKRQVVHPSRSWLCKLEAAISIPFKFGESRCHRRNIHQANSNLQIIDPNFSLSTIRFELRWINSFLIKKIYFNSLLSMRILHTP